MNFQMMQVLPNLNSQQSHDEPKQSWQTCLDPRLQEQLTRFKEIQKNPQLLLQTLSEMEHQKKRQVKETTEKDTKKYETIVVDKCHENTLVCYICGNSLRRRSMKAHLDTHNGRTYTCTIDHCNAVYKSKHGFTSHQLVHHSKRTSLTEKGIVQILSASQVENGKKSYICKVCGRCLQSKYTFLEHSRIHTGEKSKRCRLCYRRFRKECTLRIHLKTCLRAVTFPVEPE